VPRILRVLTIVGLPTATMPGILDDFNALAFPYRWSTRAIMLDKLEATTPDLDPATVVRQVVAENIATVNESFSDASRAARDLVSASHELSDESGRWITRCKASSPQCAAPAGAC
jgi:type IV secretory pathway VirB4 component